MSHLPHGPAVRGNEIVPAGPGIEGDGMRPVLPALGGVALCALGGCLTTTTLDFLGPALIAFGLVTCAPRGRLREMLPGLAVALAAVVGLGVHSGAVAVADGVLAWAAALAVSLALLKGRLTPGAICAAVATLAVCHLGVDAGAVAASGTTLPEAVSETLTYVRQGLAGTSPAAAAQAESSLSLVEVLWPLSYVITALVEGLSALLGAWLAVGDKSEVKRPRLAEFDLPLWVVTALVAAIAGLAVAITVPEVPGVVLVVAANLVVALRYAFLAQGTGVVSWFLDRNEAGIAVRTLVVLMGVCLEVLFYVVTIVGLVDVWANFRRLRGGGRPGSTGNAEQDKEPADAG